MESLVDTVTGTVPDARVTRVRLSVGRLSCASPEALQFCFDVCTRETSLEGAVLEILPVEARGWCASCSGETALTAPAVCAVCGSPEVRILSGTELRLKDVEVL